VDWLQIVGLCVDILGALVIGWPLIVMKDDKARESASPRSRQAIGKKDLQLPYAP
jgi:hypothetical protein